MSRPDKRTSALSSLEEAVREGRADHQVLPLLSLINSFDEYATTSSCAGRIQLIGVPEVGDKEGSVIYGKWHDPVEPEDVLSALPELTEGVYFMAQPLLVHVRCIDLASAVEIWRCAHSSGLKYTTIRSVQIQPDRIPEDWGITVEVQGTERMEVPLQGISRRALDECIPLWVIHANSLLRRTRARMAALAEALSGLRNKA